MKGGKAGRPRRGGTQGSPRKVGRPGARKGVAKRPGGTQPKKGGKPPREFGGFTTSGEE